MPIEELGEIVHNTLISYYNIKRCNIIIQCKDQESQYLTKWKIGVMCSMCNDPERIEWYKNQFSKWRKT